MRTCTRCCSVDEPSALDWKGADWPLLKNYRDALVYGHVDVFLLNSLLYAVVLTTVQLSINVLAAYAFARMKFRGAERSRTRWAFFAPDMSGLRKRSGSRCSTSARASIMAGRSLRLEWPTLGSAVKTSVFLSSTCPA